MVSHDEARRGPTHPGSCARLAPAAQEGRPGETRRGCELPRKQRPPHGLSRLLGQRMDDWLGGGRIGVQDDSRTAPQTSGHAMAGIRHRFDVSIASPVQERTEPMAGLLAAPDQRKNCRSNICSTNSRDAYTQLALEPLEKLLGRDSRYSNYAGWHLLIETRSLTGNSSAALEQCRELARGAATLQHQCLLAEDM